MKNYIHRTIEEQLSKISKQFPVTAITGPRQTGKSTLLKGLFPDYNYITFDDTLTRTQAKEDPAYFTDTLQLPVIIDEIQYVPEILPYIKMRVDKYTTTLRNDEINGKFILTGSQVFTMMSGLTETLAGRIALFELLPFSFAEIGSKPHNPIDCYKQILKGFYPVPNTQKTDSSKFYGSYLTTYIERDVRQIINIKDLNVFQKFLELVAARTGSLLNITELAKECAITRATADKWLSVLESSRIIYILKPYFKNITKRVVKSPKVYFTDTGLLAYLLKYYDAKALMAGAMSGHIFENMIFLEILKNKFNGKNNFDIYFYRDSNGVEVDFCVDKGQEVLLLEVKSGKNIGRTDVKNLSSVPLKGEKIIVSFFENQLPMTREIDAVPWWELKI
jgi:predicted AAA+ superfamily ATPase